MHVFGVTASTRQTMWSTSQKLVRVMLRNGPIWLIQYGTRRMDAPDQTDTSVSEVQTRACAGESIMMNPNDVGGRANVDTILLKETLTFGKGILIREIWTNGGAIRITTLVWSAIA